MSKKCTKKKDKVSSKAKSEHVNNVFQRRFTISKPSIEFSVNPRLRVKKAAKEPKLSQEKRSRLRIKTKKDKAKPKVKIFLEYPDEIEQFETGICAADVKDEKQLADDNEMNDFKFQTPQKTPLAARHISPLVSLRMPPPQNRIFFSPQKYYSHSPYQTPGNDSRMNLNPHFNQQYQVQNYRRFSVCEERPQLRQPPLPNYLQFRRHPMQCNPNFRSPPGPDFYHQKRLRSLEDPRNLPLQKHYKYHHENRWRQSPSNIFRPSNQEVQYFQRNMPSTAHQISFLPSRHHRRNHSRKRSHRDKVLLKQVRASLNPNSNARSLSPSVSDNLPGQVGTSWVEKLKNSNALMQEADSTMAEKDCKTEPKQQEVKVCSFDVVTSSGIPFDDSPIKDFRNIVRFPVIEMLENLAKRNERKMKRDSKRMEKKMRKMTLREEIQVFEETGIRVYASDKNKTSWIHNNLRKLQQVNVFELGCAANPITWEEIRDDHKKIRLTHGEKKFNIEKKRLEAAETAMKEQALLGLPQPPPGNPPKQLWQPQLIKISEIFRTFSVNTEPILREMKNKMFRRNSIFLEAHHEN